MFGSFIPFKIFRIPSRNTKILKTLKVSTVINNYTFCMFSRLPIDDCNNLR